MKFKCFKNRKKFKEWKKNDVNTEDIDRKKLSDLELYRKIEAKKTYLNYLKEKSRDINGSYLITICLTTSTIIIGIITYCNSIYANISKGNEEKGIFNSLLNKNIDLGAVGINVSIILIFIALVFVILRGFMANFSAYKMALREIDLNLYLEEEKIRKDENEKVSNAKTNINTKEVNNKPKKKK